MADFDPDDLSDDASVPAQSPSKRSRTANSALEQEADLELEFSKQHASYRFSGWQNAPSPAMMPDPPQQAVPLAAGSPVTSATPGSISMTVAGPPVMTVSAAGAAVAAPPHVAGSRLRIAQQPDRVWYRDAQGGSAANRVSFTVTLLDMTEYETEALSSYPPRFIVMCEYVDGTAAHPIRAPSLIEMLETSFTPLPTCCVQLRFLEVTRSHPGKIPFRLKVHLDPTSLHTNLQYLATHVAYTSEITVRSKVPRPQSGTSPILTVTSDATSSQASPVTAAVKRQPPQRPVASGVPHLAPASHSEFAYAPDIARPALAPPVAPAPPPLPPPHSAPMLAGYRSSPIMSTMVDLPASLAFHMDATGSYFHRSDAVGATPSPPGVPRGHAHPAMAAPSTSMPSTMTRTHPIWNATAIQASPRVPLPFPMQVAQPPYFDARAVQHAKYEAYQHLVHVLGKLEPGGRLPQVHCRMCGEATHLPACPFQDILSTVHSALFGILSSTSQSAAIGTMDKTL